MRKLIKIWFLAIFKDAWFWRVTYQDGKKTRLLSYGEARSLKDVFGGKLYIDHKLVIKTRRL